MLSFITESLPHMGVCFGRNMSGQSKRIYLSHFTERDRFANKEDKYAWKAKELLEKYNIADW